MYIVNKSIRHFFNKLSPFVKIFKKPITNPKRPPPIKANIIAIIKNGRKKNNPTE